MKNTNRALLSSVVALILCCSMLVGSTFAWFTDEVKSGTNIISAGNLDVELYHQDKAGSGKVDTTTTLFDDVAKWEPGAVVFENLTVSNEGNLALKYKLAMVVADENKVLGANGKGLSEALKVAVVKGGVDATLSREELIASITTWKTLNEWNAESSLLAGVSETYGIVIYWEPTTNDNEWNVNNDKATDDGQDLWINLGINLVATQLNHEVDSFDKDYDKNATYTDVPTTPMTGVAVDVYDFAGTGKQPETMTLDFTCYTFDAAEFQSAYPVELYKNWICDYYVSTDKPLKDGLVLVGNYGNYGWLGFYAPESTEAYPPTPLLGTVTQNMNAWNYQTICKDVQIFKCGLVDTMGLNVGTNVTVELCMLNPENHEDRRTVCSITVTLTQEVNTADELAAALENGGLITLTGDIELNDKPVTIAKGTEVTLDLNGHTLSGVSTSTTTSNLIKVNADSELTIKNGTVSFRATNPDTDWNPEGFPGYANNTISCLGKLVIDGATIENLTPAGGASYAIDCYQGSDLTVNSGVIDGHGKVAIRMFCNSNTESTNVTINGGIITGRRAVWVQLPGSNAANVRPVVLTINGGKLICEDPTSELCVYAYSFGDSFANTTINIAGGNFIGNIGYAGGVGAPALNITGGTINGEVGYWDSADQWVTIPTP